MLALKVIPTKHTLKLLFGVTCRKQGSPLNLTVVMAISKWADEGGLIRGLLARLAQWDCQSWACWLGFREFEGDEIPDRQSRETKAERRSETQRRKLEST